MLLVIACMLSAAFNGAVGEPYAPTNAFREPVAHALYDFGMDMYNQLEPSWRPTENIVISPMSMYAILSILLPGLNGASHDQVYNALRMTNLPRNGVDAESAMCSKIFQINPNYDLTRANRIFGDRTLTFKKSYKNETSWHHKAAHKKVDFQHNPNGARHKMNRYVSKMTDGEIQQLIPREAVTTDTRIFLVNAIAFKAAWKSSFIKDATTLTNFHVSPTKVKQAATMYTSSAVCFHQSHDAQLESDLIVLPFKGAKTTMVFIVPIVAGNFGPLKGAVGASKISQALDRYWTGYRNMPIPMRVCEVRMPKFKITHSVDDLMGAMRAMNVTDIFSTEADFSPMTPELVYVTDMRHKAVIKVNEQGVKATAATSIGLTGRSLPIRVEINRPFMYMIRHEPTGALLFLGRVVDPTK
uniref:Not2 n=1 Tax=Ciona intestinalis TaxID=7719 RepID=Q9NDQ6_CIOIN|nr:Not2 protein precursor [Ciona intestinalis]BAB00620.1 Not2 [Ciona intestinalis]|eukprot:NP_001027950.1 Not2 protein precursor [Ciona intestinalis]